MNQYQKERKANKGKGTRKCTEVLETVCKMKQAPGALQRAVSSSGKSGPETPHAEARAPAALPAVPACTAGCGEGWGSITLNMQQLRRAKPSCAEHLVLIPLPQCCPPFLLQRQKAAVGPQQSSVLFLLASLTPKTLLDGNFQNASPREEAFQIWA